MGESPLQLDILVGSEPSQVCSVGQFARREFHALLESALPGEKFNLFTTTDTLLSSHHLSSNRNYWTLVHMPSLAERGSPLAPLEKALRVGAWGQAPAVVNLHEYSEAPDHWRLRTQIWIPQFRGVVVNTLEDYRQVSLFHGQVHYLPLAAPLEAPPESESSWRESVTRAYSDWAHRLNLQRWILFSGLITEDKGLDEFFVQRANKFPDLPVVVAGSVGPTPRDQRYFEALRSEANNTQFLLNLSDKDFCSLLAASPFVFLPFRSGVSERRSSFLTAASWGSHVFTTLGPFSKDLCLPGPLQQWDQNFAPALNTQAPWVNERAWEHRRLIRNWASQRTWTRRVRELRGILKQIAI